MAPPEGLFLSELSQVAASPIVNSLKAEEIVMSSGSCPVLYSFFHCVCTYQVHKEPGTLLLQLPEQLTTNCWLFVPAVLLLLLLCAAAWTRLLRVLLRGGGCPVWLCTLPSLLALCLLHGSKRPGREAALCDTEGLVAKAHALLSQRSARQAAAHQPPAGQWRWSKHGSSGVTAAGLKDVTAVQGELKQPFCTSAVMIKREPHTSTRASSETLLQRPHLKPASSACACSGVAFASSCCSRASMPRPSRNTPCGMGPKQSAAAPVSSTEALQRGGKERQGVRSQGPQQRRQAVTHARHAAVLGCSG